MASKIKKTIVLARRKVYSIRHNNFDNFVFIHINKTGGSSIEKALKIPLEHKTAREKIEQIGIKNWNKKFTFAVVRNPWDKVVSHYHYRVQTNQTNLRDKQLDFNEWVKRTYGDKDDFYYDNPKMFMPQSDWISDDSGNIIIDYICRFENLREDFNRVCNLLGKSAELPHHKSSKHSKYSDYYNNDSKEIITSWFSKDIKNFSYQYL